MPAPQVVIDGDTEDGTAVVTETDVTSILLDTETDEESAFYIGGPRGEKGDPGQDGLDGADSTVPGPPGADGAPGTDFSYRHEQGPAALIWDIYYPALPPGVLPIVDVFDTDSPPRRLGVDVVHLGAGHLQVQLTSASSGFAVLR